MSGASAMKPLERTGSTANLTYYAERGRPDGSVWVEVLTSVLEKKDGRWRARRVPVQHVTVYRLGVGEVASFSFRAREFTERGLGQRVRSALAEVER